MLDDEVVTPTDDAATTDDSTAAVEAEARTQGWRPKAEYEKLKGADPEKWVDAATFVERGKESLPILRDQLRKVRDDNREMRTLVKDVLANQKADRERTIQETITKLQTEKRTAVEEADPVKVEAIDKQIDKLKDGAKEKKDDAVVVEGGALGPEFAAWEKANKWFRDDFTLRRFAIAQFDILCEDPETADLSDTEKLKLVTSETRKRYSEKFANPARKNAALVESGGNGSQRSNGKHGYSDLPQEARELCDRLVKQKVLTRDEYVAKYEF